MTPDEKAGVMAELHALEDAASIANIEFHNAIAKAHAVHAAARDERLTRLRSLLARTKAMKGQK